MFIKGMWKGSKPTAKDCIITQIFHPGTKRNHNDRGDVIVGLSAKSASTVPKSNLVCLISALNMPRITIKTNREPGYGPTEQRGGRGLLIFSLLSGPFWKATIVLCWLTNLESCNWSQLLCRCLNMEQEQAMSWYHKCHHSDTSSTLQSSTESDQRPACSYLISKTLLFRGAFMISISVQQVPWSYFSECDRVRTSL